MIHADSYDRQEDYSECDVIEEVLIGLPKSTLLYLTFWAYLEYFQSI